MFRLVRFSTLAFFLMSALHGQIPSSQIQASGTANINVMPDQAQLTISVISQGNTAQDTAQQNAQQTTDVIGAVQKTLGSAGTIQTIGYSLNPRYNSSNPPVIAGYTATNSLKVVMNDVNTLPGRVIDAANQAGANNISGISFGLQDSEPTLRQALSQAAKTAMAHAGAIASGLGVKTGAVLSAQEAGSVQPAFAVLTGMVSSTPVQTGTVSVTATVALTVQIAQ